MASYILTIPPYMLRYGVSSGYPIVVLHLSPMSLTCSILLPTGPSSEPSVVESKDRKANAHLILKLMCDSMVLRPHLRELLSAK